MTTGDAPDPLSALAPLLRVRPELQAICRFGEQWSSQHETPEPSGWAAFHLVTAGACVLEMDAAGPTRLHAGDIAVLPHGDTHLLRDLPGAPVAPGVPPATGAAIDGIAVRGNGHVPTAELICGRLQFRQPHNGLARAALPALIVVRTGDDPAAAPLRDLLLTIRRELASPADGSRSICEDLASALLVMVLRIHFRRETAQPGLPRLLSEPQTARAVIAMLGDLGRAWQLDELAGAAGTSRASLVRDFRRLADMTPFDLLTDLRLTLARHRLATGAGSLADIADDAGYQSPAAFGRAFKRRFARSPGDIRRTRAE